jgi:phosphate starvation-inducible protein PhoH and related proteins
MSDTTKDKNKKYVFRKKSPTYSFNIRELPWTHKQQSLIQLLQKRDTKCCFIVGGAGTSKTMCAVYAGLQLLKSKKISDITYVRSAVESSHQKLGFLPGYLDEKFKVYSTPLLEKMEELLDTTSIQHLTEKDFVRSTPINYMRGLHISGRLLILDESQNFTYEELVTAVTRIGESSRIWILGDPKQSDLMGGKSGFTKFMNNLVDPDDPECTKYGIHRFEFTVDDIVRSEFCKYVIKKLELD